MVRACALLRGADLSGAVAVHAGLGATLVRVGVRVAVGAAAGIALAFARWLSSSNASSGMLTNSDTIVRCRTSFVNMVAPLALK
jgi:hypothetical protein